MRLRQRLRLVGLGLLITAGAILSRGTPCYGDEAQLWDFVYLRLHSEEERYLDLTLHGRLTEGWSNPSLYQLQPRYSFRVLPWLRLGTNYSFLAQERAVRTAGEDKFVDQNRLEFEAMPSFQPYERFEVNQRTRFEYLMDNEWQRLNTRVRHRVQLLYPEIVNQSLRPISSLELFYDYGARGLNQSRFVPFGVRFKALGLEWGFSPMWLANERDSRWAHSFVTQVETWVSLE